MAIGCAIGPLTAALWIQTIGSPHQPSKTLPSPAASRTAMLTRAIKRLGTAAFGLGALALTMLCATRGAFFGAGLLSEGTGCGSDFDGGANGIGGSLRPSGAFGGWRDGCGSGAGAGAGAGGSGLATNLMPGSSVFVVPPARSGTTGTVMAGVASVGARASPNVGQSLPGASSVGATGVGLGARSGTSSATSLGVDAEATAAAAAALSWLARFKASRSKLMVSFAPTVT